jgi:hypothetical protein
VTRVLIAVADAQNTGDNDVSVLRAGTCREHSPCESRRGQ